MIHHRRRLIPRLRLPRRVYPRRLLHPRCRCLFLTFPLHEFRSRRHRCPDCRRFRHYPYYPAERVCHRQPRHWIRVWLLAAADWPDPARHLVAHWPTFACPYQRSPAPHPEPDPLIARRRAFHCRFLPAWIPVSVAGPPWRWMVSQVIAPAAPFLNWIVIQMGTASAHWVGFLAWMTPCWGFAWVTEAPAAWAGSAVLNRRRRLAIPMCQRSVSIYSKMWHCACVCPSQLTTGKRFTAPKVSTATPFSRRGRKRFLRRDSSTLRRAEAAALVLCSVIFALCMRPLLLTS